MSKWIITWNAGFGEKSEIVEFETYEEALEDAYQAWKNEAEANATYTATELNDGDKYQKD